MLRPLVACREKRETLFLQVIGLIRFPGFRRVVVPPPGRPALEADSYDANGERAGIEPHASISWAMNTKDRLKLVRLKLACHARAVRDRTLC